VQTAPKASVDIEYDASGKVAAVMVHGDPFVDSSIVLDDCGGSFRLVRIGPRPHVGAGVRDKRQDQTGEVVGHTSEGRPIVRWADGTERSRSADDLDVIRAT